MNYYIQIGTINKAKQDIDEIFRAAGHRNLTFVNFGKGGAGRFFTKLVSVTSILFRMKKGDCLWLQYPMKKFYKLATTFAKWKGAGVVTVIHDLGAFRRHKITPEEEQKRLEKTDFLIVHNPTMGDYLIDNGFKGGIHCLQIFDYLSPCQPADYATPHKPCRIVYAGNLGRRRNEFLYHMAPCVNRWRMDLYGKGFDDEANDCGNLLYHGFMPSDKFIATAEADFGLVWDGDATGECSGAWGEYLRINDPHKTSFYLRAGIPVIVWSQAAMAPFILENKLGIAVDGLQDLDETLANITREQYNEMRANARKIGHQLAEGHFMKTAMQAAQQYLK